jgi:trehalose 6-phosphate synthase/phosphatase
MIMSPHTDQTINLISNRLPITVSKRRGKLDFRQSTGGLATGLASISNSGKRRWIGWPGIASENMTRHQRAEIEKYLSERDSVPVFLTRNDVKQHYMGFCNETIWPLFHYFPTYAKYHDSYWSAYQRVNRAFRDVVVDHCSREELIWIHDYHLMLLPRLLRDTWPDAKIGFFLHIPFPSFEIFRLLPWRHQILDGILGADVVGFHTFDYVRHFLSSVTRLEDVKRYMDTLEVPGRSIKVEAFPMGIDYAKYSGATSRPEVRSQLASIRKEVGDRKVIISIDRLDYTKGIIQRLEAFDAFLSQHDEYKERVTLILLAVPSRSAVGDYAKLRETVERLVSKINGTHGVIGWVPVWYLYRSVSFERLVAIYEIGDVAMVTPLRDGMNLIAKEFVAAKTEGHGVLVLSEMAGAASELGEAVTVNANDRQAIVDALKTALEMPESEQEQRMRSMQNRLRRHDISNWALNFISNLENIQKARSRRAASSFSTEAMARIVRDYKDSTRHLLILDYDQRIPGALRDVDKAEVHGKIRDYLKSILRGPENEVVFISDLDKETLENWLGDLDASLVAERGAWIREKHRGWQMIEPMPTAWKQTVKTILEMYTSRTPGSFVEEKEHSLLWHYRDASAEPEYHRKQELKEAISAIVEHLNIEVIEHDKTIEIVNAGVRKSQVARLWLGRQNWDFIMGISADPSGDDLFLGFPDNAHSIHLGPGVSSARINVNAISDLEPLFEALTRD